MAVSIAATLFMCIAWLCLMYFVKYLIQHQRYYRLASKFPGIHKTIPALVAGYILAPFYKCDLYQMLRCIDRKDEDFYRVWLGGLTIFVKKPEHLQTVFFSPHLMSKSLHYEGVKDMVGSNALVYAKGAAYKKSKRIFVRGFNASSQDIIMENFRRGAKEVAEMLEKEVGPGWLKISPILRRITTANISRSAFGVEIDEKHPIIKLLSKVEKMFTAVAMKTVFPNVPLVPLITKHNSIIRETNEEIQALGRELCKRKTEDLDELSAKTKEIPNQYIYNLFRERAEDPAEDTHGDIATLLLTAMDTSALTTGYALSLLGMHPELQQRVYEEDKRIQGEIGNRDMNENDFNKYEYLSLVIKETLRLFPPVPIFSRHASEDIEIGDHTLPKGCSVAIYIPYVHRDPKNFPDPMRFDPDRFLPENMEKRHKCSYIPFSYGMRQCPGYRYGLQSATILISSVIRKYKVFSIYKTVEELDSNLQGFITLVDKNDIPVRLELRPSEPEH